MLETIVRQSNDLQVELLPLCLSHSRIGTDVAVKEAGTINRYIGSAIQATENYLDKDLWPYTHTYSGVTTFPFVWTRGRAVVKAKVPDSGAPGTFIDALVQPTMDGRVDLRSAALRIGLDGYTMASNGILVIDSGFATVDEMPDDVVEFILAVFGTHFELRELSNYSSAVFNVDNYPKYLLDPYRTLSYA